MKKVLLMGFTKIAYMPYMNFYLEALDGADAEIHVVKWQRDQEADIALGDDRVVVHEFARTQADEVAKFSKIGNFLKYRAFVKRLLKRMGFDRIIVLHTLRRRSSEKIPRKIYSGLSRLYLRKFFTF